MIDVSEKIAHNLKRIYKWLNHHGNGFAKLIIGSWSTNGSYTFNGQSN